jgi:hypothetical protein
MSTGAAAFKQLERRPSYAAQAIMANGAFGSTAVTALTAQNTQGVHGILPTPLDFVRQQMDVVLSGKCQFRRLGWMRGCAAAFVDMDQGLLGVLCC